MFARRKKFYLKLHQSQSNKRSFIYKRKKFTNPFFHKSKTISLKVPKFSWRLKLIIIEIFLLVLGLIWFFGFSSVFEINKIIINGAQNISSSEIENLAWQQTKQWHGLQKNIFIFKNKSLIKKITDKYYLDNLSVIRNLPDTITISFNEKTHAAIWLEAEKYYYIDNQGNMIEQVDPLNIKEKNYPLIDNTGKAKINGKKIDIATEKIKFILDLFEKFKNKSYNFVIERFVVDDNEDTVSALVLNGPIILFSTRDSLDKQMSKLDVVINEKLKTDFIKKVSIDLRYGDRIYYR